MQQLITFQLENLGFSALFGIQIAIVYEFLRCLRRIILHNNFFIAFEDLIFWIGTTILAIEKLKQHNYGIPRMYLFLGFCWGAILMICMLEALVMPFLFVTLKKMSKCLKKNIMVLKKVFNRVTIKGILHTSDCFYASNKDKIDYYRREHGKKVEKKKIN